MRHIITLLLGCAIISCSDRNHEIEPQIIADFTMEIDLFDYYTVHFTNHSENAVNFFWDFGNGDKSNLENPTYTYSSSGTYDVTLTVYGVNNINDTKTLTLVLVEPH
ncbi:MAG: PKD domain-containing protein [Tenuifilaceae bacterium]|jgi:PKD repeat protein|nr:PKD domain-containing protein [Tenuifilaceae bacterium]